MVGAVRTLTTHFRKHGRLVGERDGVYNVPVQYIEFGIAHRIQMLQNDFFRVVVTTRVNHGGAKLVAWKINDGGAIDKSAAVDQLGQSFQSIQRSVHRVGIDCNCGSNNGEVVTLISLQGQRFIVRSNVHVDTGNRGSSESSSVHGCVEKDNASKSFKGIKEDAALGSCSLAVERKTGRVHRVLDGGGRLLLRFGPRCEGVPGCEGQG